MSYAVQTDLEKLIPQGELILLTDDNDTGSVDAGVIAAALDDASEIIDSYLAGQYSLPFSSPPPILKIMCIRIAGHGLHARRNQVSEVWNKYYDNSLRFLEKVASGEISLGATDPEPAGSETLKVDAAPALFSREELERY